MCPVTVQCGGAAFIPVEDYLGGAVTSSLGTSGLTLSISINLSIYLSSWRSCHLLTGDIRSLSHSLSLSLSHLGGAVTSSLRTSGLSLTLSLSLKTSALSLSSKRSCHLLTGDIRCLSLTLSLYLSFYLSISLSSWRSCHLLSGDIRCLSLILTRDIRSLSHSLALSHLEGAVTSSLGTSGLSLSLSLSLSLPSWRSYHALTGDIRCLSHSLSLILEEL